MPRAKSPQELLKQEELRRKQQEQALVMRHDSFQRESKQSKLNNLKLNGKWSNLQTLAKTRELQLLLGSLEQLNVRQQDKLQNKLLLLSQQLQETDQQYDVCYQSHLRNMDIVVELLCQNLHNLLGEFKMNSKQQKLRFDQEKQSLVRHHLKAKNDLLGIVYRLDQDFQETESDARHEYQSQSDDVRNKNLEEKHALRIQLESYIEDLWRQFQNALTQYNQSTDERKKQFEDLKKKDEQSALCIEMQVRKLSRLTETIQTLKTRLVYIQRESETKLGALRQSKEHVVKDLQILKRKMNLNREKERRKLIRVTHLSLSSQKHLNLNLKIAEKILNYGEMNFKLCTEEEKACWDKSQEIYFLDNFHRLYNKVLLDKKTLENQKQNLKEEKQALLNVLNLYLEGISINKKTLMKPNPLVVVNFK